MHGVASGGGGGRKGYRWFEDCDSLESRQLVVVEAAGAGDNDELYARRSTLEGGGACRGQGCTVRCVNIEHTTEDNCPRRALVGVVADHRGPRHECRH